MSSLEEYRRLHAALHQAYISSKLIAKDYT